MRIGIPKRSRLLSYRSRTRTLARAWARRVAAPWTKSIDGTRMLRYSWTRSPSSRLATRPLQDRSRKRKHENHRLHFWDAPGSREDGARGAGVATSLE